MALLLLFVFISSHAEAMSGAEGMCPLPLDYRVMMDGVARPNSPHMCFNKAGMTVSKDIVPELLPSSVNAAFTVMEDEPHTYGFVAISSTGQKRYPLELVGGHDQTTADNFVNWMPLMGAYHPLELDMSPGGVKMFGANYGFCYEFLGFRDQKKIKKDYDDPGNLSPDGFKWTGPNDGDFKGWLVNDVHLVYHMDSPTLYGFFGNIGNNPDKYISFNGYIPFDYTYFIPSVPTWYAISSVLAIRWDWPYKYSHNWLIHHFDEDADGICDFCGMNYMAKEPYTYDSPFIYSTPPRNCVSGTTEWPTGKFFMPNSHIQNPMAAERRRGSIFCFDRNGVPPVIYSNPKVRFTQPNQPVSIARATVKVRDKGNIAHVQIGIDGANTNLLKAECGKTISETMGNPDMVIRVVDNAVQAHWLAVRDNEERKSPGTDWDDRNFRANFWYETPLYQYVSYQSDWLINPGGDKNPVIDIAYSPMFVWKKKTWNSLSEFLSLDDGSTSLEAYTYRPDGKEDTYSYNSAYIIYEKKIPVASLFKLDRVNFEDVFAWHYATTSLGDMLGNPPYHYANNNSLYGTEFRDIDGQQVIEKFKFKPINFIKGKGPLKYFLEVHDGSKENTGSGKKAVEKRLNCGVGDSDPYFRENDYTQGQLKYNPEVVKYVAYSEGPQPLNPDVSVDPCKSDPPCQIEEYDSRANEWIKNHRVLNNLNANVAGGADVIKNFQAWGMIETIDKIKPNIGMKIVDRECAGIRKVYKINDFSTLPFFSEITAEAGKTWALAEKKNSYNLLLVNKSRKPRPLFSLNGKEDDIWTFNDIDSLIKGSPNSKVYQGRDFIKTADGFQDSMEPYGNLEKKEFTVSIQDMYDETGKISLAACYAYDNIDGQRLKRNGQLVRNDDWYKGVNSYDLELNVENKPSFPGNAIGKGYSSYRVIDETYPDYQRNQVFKINYMNGGNFIYPQISFKKPNCGPNGDPLESSPQQIALSYAVVDRGGNFRKIKVNFYIAPVGLNIQTIEKKQKLSR